MSAFNVNWGRYSDEYYYTHPGSAPIGAYSNHPFLAVEGIYKSSVDELIKGAEFMKQQVLFNGGIEILKHHILGCLFYEPSTRTNCSFQAAMLRLGGKVLAVNEQVLDLSTISINVTSDIQSLLTLLLTSTISTDVTSDILSHMYEFTSNKYRILV